MMPIPPPSHDIEGRMLALAKMLVSAVAEVHHVIDEIKETAGPPGPDKPRSTDVPS